MVGLDVTDVCADMAVAVPERANLEGGPPLHADQVDNMNFLMRLGDTVMGTLQVSLTSWFGTGYGFQVYGTEGMLMVKVEDAALDPGEMVEGLKAQVNPAGAAASPLV